MQDSKLNKTAIDNVKVLLFEESVNITSIKKIRLYTSHTDNVARLMQKYD